MMKLIGKYHLVKTWDYKCTLCGSENLDHDPEIAGMGQCMDCKEFFSKNYLVLD